MEQRVVQQTTGSFLREAPELKPSHTFNTEFSITREGAPTQVGFATKRDGQGGLKVERKPDIVAMVMWGGVRGGPGSVGWIVHSSSLMNLHVLV